MTTRRAPRIVPARISPADYLADPAKFGIDPAAGYVQPAAGDTIAAELAWAHHQLMVKVRAKKLPGTAREVSRQFGFSTSTWSNARLGKIWMTPQLWAAATTIL